MADFNGNNKPNISEQISSSSLWTAFARVSSIVAAPIGVVVLAVSAWALSALVEVEKTTVRTETQFEDFQRQVEQNRQDTKEKLDAFNQSTSDKFNTLTSGLERLSERLDGLTKTNTR